MRIALVSPYSWTYPGGVTRHIEALAGELLRAGHEPRILAPHDPDDRLARRLHRGARPQERDVPDHMRALGRTVGIKANGAVSNLAITPGSVFALREELRTGGYDVVHIHEPLAPMLSWDALACIELPLVGTFHAYSENTVSNQTATLLGARRRLNRLHVRIAVSEAAAWTACRFFGGRYRIVPNGVDLGPASLAEAAANPATVDADRPLRIVFVGLPVERKGLPVLMRAFEAVREHVPTTLTLIGATPQDIEHIALDDAGIEALGMVPDEVKRARVREADVLCAPSLHGESFGMVLTEAFAEGTPVVASDIPGYRDVARDGVEGLLVPPGDPLALAEALRSLAIDPARRAAMATAARERAERFAWPRVAAEVIEAYEDAIAVPRPEGRARSLAVRYGLAPADLQPPVRARRLPSLQPAPTLAPAQRALRLARRVALLALAFGGVGLALLALSRIGLDRVAASLVTSKPDWVVIALAVMCASMAVRGLAWHAILKAAPTWRQAKRSDALQGTFIGVLMSATLPARLGEPSRALIVARRLGRPRETLPVVLGTMVSQTLLNLLALAILGIAMFSSVSLFNGHHGALLIATLAPIGALLCVLLLPVIVPRSAAGRHARMQALLAKARTALVRVREGLRVFRRPRLAAEATLTQLAAWGLQALSCYFLLVALGLDSQVDFAGAAGVLFAVNVTAVLPATPSNLGVFQAACVAVLTGAYHVHTADALAYGIILQAVEISTALIMGGPALVKEGLSWKDVRLRAMHTAPVRLPPLPASAARQGSAIGVARGR